MEHEDKTVKKRNKQAEGKSYFRLVEKPVTKRPPRRKLINKE